VVRRQPIGEMRRVALAADAYIPLGRWPVSDAMLGPPERWRAAPISTSCRKQLPYSPAVDRFRGT
jgi:hypothetical protein